MLLHEQTQTETVPKTAAKKASRNCSALQVTSKHVVKLMRRITGVEKKERQQPAFYTQKAST
jgi:hypothetical protein